MCREVPKLEKPMCREMQKSVAIDTRRKEMRPNGARTDLSALFKMPNVWEESSLLELADEAVRAPFALDSRPSEDLPRFGLLSFGLFTDRT